jgi:hypothetical protein
LVVVLTDLSRRLKARRRKKKALEKQKIIEEYVRKCGMERKNEW